MNETREKIVRPKEAVKYLKELFFVGKAVLKLPSQKGMVKEF